jgi:hypothetical protein
VKKQSPFLFVICLLMATTGCYQLPAKSVVLIPSSDSKLPSVYAEHGGTLKFKMDDGSPAGSTFQVQFSQPVCETTDNLNGTNTQPVTCHVTAQSGDYDITINETIGGTGTTPSRTMPPTILKAYIRPCNNCV